MFSILQAYFGKRGISVHIDVFIMKLNGTWFKAVYITALDKSDQDMLETLSIAEIVLKKFHSDFPHIKSVLGKSDNAGCYHSAATVEVLTKILRKLQINLEQYDFSEPQLGKDACDREAAYIKRRYNEFLNKSSANKIQNAKELVEAIMSDGGPKNVKAIVLTIDKSKTKLNKKCQIPNISMFHSYEPKGNGITHYEYYQIGPGIFIPFKGVELQSATEQSNWYVSSRQNVDVEHSRNQSLFMCRTLRCKAVFSTQDELLEHQSAGEHTHIEPKTGMDKAREAYVELKNFHHLDYATVSISSVNPMENLNLEQRKNFADQYIIGWGRKSRKYVKFTEKQKQFVKNLFMKGEQSKTNKVTANKISKLMMTHKENNKPYFAVHEQLDEEQIKGLIKRFSAERQNKKEVLEVEDEIEDDIDEV